MAAGRVATARAFSLLAGLAYAVMALWGFVDGGSVASVFAVNTADNVTHAGIGALALIAGLAPVSAQRGDTVGAEARREHERHGQDPSHVFPA